MNFGISPTKRVFFTVVAFAVAIVAINLLFSTGPFFQPVHLCETTQARFVPHQVKYVPPHTNGDRDFDANGPDVGITVTLLNRGTQIDVEVYMRAVETKSDWTIVEGAMIARRVYKPPPGQRVGKILSTISVEDHYQDTDHQTDRLEPGEPVDRLEIVGDQKGDDAGTHTGVTVYFNYVALELVEDGNCISPYHSRTQADGYSADTDPLLVGSPGDWLPDTTEIAYGLELRRVNILSNEEVAAQYKDPVDVTNKLQAWGRIESHTHFYAHEKGCEANSGINAVYLQSVLYESVEGAGKGFEWEKGRAEETPHIRRISFISEVGEQAFISWSNSTDTCEPEHDLRTVYVTFQRHNALGLVAVRSIKQTVSDQELEATAIQLAQVIDMNFQEAGR